MKRTWALFLCVLLSAVAIAFDPRTNKVTRAQATGPTMFVPNLGVRQVIGENLITPIAMEFIGPNDFFLLEKNTGKVQRVVNGAVQSTVLDLGVNNNSERGLLGIALRWIFGTRATRRSAIPFQFDREQKKDWSGRSTSRGSRG